jgi:outer membrane protein TolC
MQYWNDDITFSFGGGGGGAALDQLPPPQNPYQSVIRQMFGSSSETVIREQFTWDASVTLAQPLTPLWAISEGYSAARIGEDVAETNLSKTQRDQAREASIAYFRVLQAESSFETAKQSVEQLKAQLERVSALVATGSAQKNDRLRIQVALANAKQKRSRAKSDLQMARSNLAVQIGRAPETDIEASAVGRNDIPTLSGSLSSTVSEAMETRPELEQLEMRLEQLGHQVDIETADYLPQINGLGQYSHQAGQGLTGQDTAFVGLSLDWNVWQWGKRKYQIDEAEAKVVKLESQLIETKRQLKMQVRSAWYDLKASLESYDVADAAVAQAKEAYRVESARYEAGKATPTELLDAQSSLTEAKNNRTAARFETLINYTKLTHATGRPLNAKQLLGGNNG